MRSDSMAVRRLLAEIHRQQKKAAREKDRAAREQARQLKFAESMDELSSSIEETLRRNDEFMRNLIDYDKNITAKENEVSELNFKLNQVYEDIDGLLASTLNIDDYVDLSSLRKDAEHPKFDRPDLENPAPKPRRPKLPKKPELNLPKEPSGILKMFTMKKHLAHVAAASHAHELAIAQWKIMCDKLNSDYEDATRKYFIDEENRQLKLEEEYVRYRQECAARDLAAAEQNKALDELIANLAYGVPEAIEEYIAIVLANSVYPDQFPVAHDFKFDAEHSELSVSVYVPEPASIPTIKAYKLIKAKNEISSTTLTQKEVRERYASAVYQVALRTFHEVYESDRRGIIKTISLEVGTKAIDPATGLLSYIPFVKAASERETFIKFELSGVQPAQTLGLLGASVSKNPYSLTACVKSGIRAV